MNPSNWSIVFYFIAIATCSSLSYGWLVKYRKLPFKAIVSFSDAQWQFLKVWVKIALLLGVVVPVIFSIVFWNDLILRQFFICYLLVVGIQLASESILSRILCQSIVVVIGTLYTGFRIWQLWFGLQLTNYSQPWLILLWLVFLFWVANIVMLITIAIPNILPQTNQENLSDRKLQ